MQSGASNSTSYSPTSNHIVSTAGTSPLSYGYDALGNITTLNGTTTYQYDAFNRMSAAGGMSYYVGPEGQRLRKTGSAGTTYFAPDTNGTLIAEDDSGAWIDYIWLGGNLVGREVNGQLEVIGDDQLGRPQVVTNASQTVVWSAVNDPFTRSITLSNSAPLNIGYPGQYYDAETGLWNNGFRDYDSTLGRYVESDPAGLYGGINTYAYVGGNPVNFADPLGLAPGDCYATRDQAGRQAVADINPASINENREYAGWIYQTPNGWYSYTAPNPGGYDSSRPGPEVPGIVGRYHTHGGSSPGAYWWSPQDLNNIAYGKTGYLGVPSGQIFKYQPGGSSPFSELTSPPPGNSNSCGCGGTNSTLNQVLQNLFGH
jgi:RHS repeat-associated protein